MHASARATRVASAGRLALEAYQRRYAGTGASTSLLGNLEAGRTYAFSADVRVGDGRGSQAMTYAYLYLESQGRPGEYLPLGGREWPLGQPARPGAIAEGADQAC